MKSRQVVGWIAAGMTLALLSAVVAGYVLARPYPVGVGPLPADLAGRKIEFPGAEGATLRGWFVPSDAHRGTILLMHGVRSNRLQMLDRAQFLHRAGYSVLLFDSRAHGESGGNAITFGYLESRDAQAAVELIREMAPGQPIGVIGASLGGAATVLAKPRLEVDALVLESVYPTINQAISDRLKLRFGPPAAWLTHVLTFMFRPRLGFSANELRPIDAVRNLTTPKMFIFGSRDRHTTAEESRDLFERASEPKELWEIDGAAHVDLYAYAGLDYEKRVLRFLDANLHSRRTAADAAR